MFTYIDDIDIPSLTQPYKVNYLVKKEDQAKRSKNS